MKKEDFIKQLRDIQKDSITCIVTSIDEEGYPTTRAMLTIQDKMSEKQMYFSTNTPSRKVRHFKQNNKGSVYFVDYKTFTGITLTGTFEVLEDFETKNYFFVKGDEKYYPLGPSDPDYCILKFTAIEAEHYHNLQTTRFSI